MTPFKSAVRWRVAVWVTCHAVLSAVVTIAVAWGAVCVSLTSIGASSRASYRQHSVAYNGDRYYLQCVRIECAGFVRQVFLSLHREGLNQTRRDDDIGRLGLNARGEVVFAEELAGWPFAAVRSVWVYRGPMLGYSTWYSPIADRRYWRDDGALDERPVLQGGWGHVAWVKSNESQHWGVIPWWPVWPGCVVDIALYGFVTGSCHALIGTWSIMRRRQRLRMGRCERCGYASGVKGCPECGLGMR